MTTSGIAANATRPEQGRLDRPVLVGGLISGGVLLLVLAFTGAWVLALIGAAYVAAGSGFLAAVYARDSVTVRQEALAWVVPWLVAVALSTWIVSLIDGGSPLLDLWAGLMVGTLSYLVWQWVALAVRRLIARQARTVIGGR